VWKCEIAGRHPARQRGRDTSGELDGGGEIGGGDAAVGPGVDREEEPAAICRRCLESYIWRRGFVRQSANMARNGTEIF
jgi:hypothetical protein